MHLRRTAFAPVPLLLAVAAATACGGPIDPIAPAERAAAPGATTTPALRFLGEAIIAPDIGEPTIGGLSGLFHAGGSTYHAISDDRGEHGPARFYTLRIELGDGALADENVTVEGWTALVGADGRPFEEGTFDFEGLTGVGDEMFVASEGVAADHIPPAILRFDKDGRLTDTLAIPAHLRPARHHGVRNNFALEALTVTPSGRLVTGTENALLQDGPAASPNDESPSRILVLDPAGEAPTAEYIYVVEPVHASGSGPDDMAVTGLVELIAVGEQQLLALERSFVASKGHSIKLFDVCLDGATDVAHIASLDDVDRHAIHPVDKRLIVDLADLGTRIDNIEGMAFGKPLPSGEQTLLFVSDDNFAPQRQVTQVLAFAAADDLLTSCPRR